MRRRTGFEPVSLSYAEVVPTAAGRRRGSPTTGGSGSIARAAWCRTPASHPSRRTRRPGVEPVRCAVARDASGNALRASCSIELMAKKAIISELSIVLFLSSGVHGARIPQLSYRSGAQRSSSGWRWFHIGVGACPHKGLNLHTHDQRLPSFQLQFHRFTARDRNLEGLFSEGGRGHLVCPSPEARWPVFFVRAGAGTSVFAGFRAGHAFDATDLGKRCQQVCRSLHFLGMAVLPSP
jgi:hypothetical protein